MISDVVFFWSSGEAGYPGRPGYIDVTLTEELFTNA
jgi:hypothetical protein